MTLSDVWNSIKEGFRPGSSAIQTTPGQTYGPAVSRLTRVPITFSTSGDPDQSGEYTSPTDLDRIFGGKGQITINPTASDIQRNYQGQVNPVIKHEIVHSVLNPVSSDQLDQMASQNPAYQHIMNNVMSTRGGEPIAEVPAYMSEPHPERYGISDELQAQYRQNLIQHLQKVNPQAAIQYQRLLGGNK